MGGNGNAQALEGLSYLAASRARAEAFELAEMVRFRDAELVRTAAIESPMVRLVERSAIALEIGQATGLSEGQVAGRLAAADRLRARAPWMCDVCRVCATGASCGRVLCCCGWW